MLGKPYYAAYPVDEPAGRNDGRKIDDPYGSLSRKCGNIAEYDLLHVAIGRDVEHVDESSGRQCAVKDGCDKRQCQKQQGCLPEI